MDMQTRAETAERLLEQLLELHDLESKKLADNYDAMRRIRRDGKRAWEIVRAHLKAVRQNVEIPAPNGSAGGRKRAADSRPAA